MGVKMFTKTEISEIESKASLLAKTKGTNPLWVRAYQRLEDAADHINAMIDRSTEK